MAVSITGKHPDSIMAGAAIYADETTTNTIRGKSYYPVVLSFGNHSTAYRSTRQGKDIIGYLPVLKCPKAIKSRPVRTAFGIAKSQVSMCVLRDSGVPCVCTVTCVPWL